MWRSPGFLQLRLSALTKSVINALAYHSAEFAVTGAQITEPLNVSELRWLIDTSINRCTDKVTSYRPAMLMQGG